MEAQPYRGRCGDQPLLVVISDQVLLMGSCDVFHGAEEALASNGRCWPTLPMAVWCASWHSRFQTQKRCLFRTSTLQQLMLSSSHHRCNAVTNGLLPTGRTLTLASLTWLCLRWACWIYVPCFKGACCGTFLAGRCWLRPEKSRSLDLTALCFGINMRINTVQIYAFAAIQRPSNIASEAKRRLMSYLPHYVASVQTPFFKRCVITGRAAVLLT
jgi:hypothetical protein